MKFVLLFLALTALIKSAHAQTSATVLVQDSTYYGSYNSQMSTSFVFLKLPSGGGSVSLTIAPGDFADSSYVTSWADHTQAGPYYIGGSSTTVNIGTAGHYWMYLAAYGTTSNYDWLEIRVVASTYSGSTSCYYCNPPNNWQSGWPPVGTPQENGVVPITSQPASPTTPKSVPRWVVPVLVVVIAMATVLPISYCLYRRHQSKKAMASIDSSTVELQSTTAV